jgi:tetratricopeptide (TPR) repeat protein
MPNLTNKRLAEQMFNAGRALFEKELYDEALIELRRAEDAFRRDDARGHPLTSHLSNGISGLANTLVISGHCHQKLGDFKAALSCYESSLINQKFENRRAIRNFKKTFTQEFIACYEKIVEESSIDREHILNREQKIDISFRFPYSLPPQAIPFARLYELAPDRYPQYKDFYQRELEKDAHMRRQSKTTDESTLKRTGIYVWGILAAIWAIYGLMTLKALIHHK